MTESSPRVAEPRRAATVLVVRDDPFEVLMVRRHAKAVFASALVFPGGAVDADDGSEEWLDLLDGAEGLTVLERSIRIAAIRETFEEASLLVAADTGARSLRSRDAETAASIAPTPDPARPFMRIVRDTGLRLDLRSLVPYGHWITPEPEPRRFDTHFLIAHATRDQIAVSDGGETTDIEWAEPAELVARAENGERSIMFPTLMSLMRLAESRTASEAMDAARARPIVTVMPRVEERPTGRVLVIPAEAGYAAQEFRLS